MSLGYTIKVLEDADLATLEAAVNVYLATIPPVTDDWDTKVSTQFYTYVGLGPPPPPEPAVQSIAITFGDPKKNKFLKMANKEMDDDNGYVVPYDGHIARITAAQKDPDVATIDYRVNGVVVESLLMDAEQKIFDVDIPVVEGDVIAAENVSNTDLKNANFTMILTFNSPAPPIPPPPPPELRHVCVVTVFEVS